MVIVYLHLVLLLCICIYRLYSCYTAIAEANELVSGANCVDINLNQFKGSLPQAITVKDSSCWMDPGGSEFMVRGQSYLKDYMKVVQVYLVCVSINLSFL